MEAIALPTHIELVHRASKLAPVLTEYADWNEENRRVHDTVIEALTEAGLFRLRVPVANGGYESDAATMVAVATELARADASAAWTVSVGWITSWMASLFPPEVRDEVLASADLRTCGTLSPSATATPTDGGYVMNGKWGFVSGAPHSQWQVLVAMAPGPGGDPWPVMALAPLSDLVVIDDWHTSGLRGSGSVTTVADNVFVPAARVMPLVSALSEGYDSGRTGIYGAPLVAAAAASVSGLAVGMARAATDQFRQRMSQRGITYTSYTSQAAAPVTHLKLAEAVLLADEAEFHAQRLAGQLDAKDAAADAWTIEDRARARADMGRACRLAQESVDLLRRASGGSSIYTSVPIQRIARDIEAMNMHALMQPETNLELYGRVLSGLAPDTLYL
ncbi:acyl-CoA dehydrogenase family protein [Plantactinospora soyae]|uniref:Alkylation response protein AidB-like acyl-CoA dehydrogenase n=1 Tax=Plantactinospora soyae TaxID=1544732 RepID=A0A927M750_9ACTN|nr:acyl-CoA dehydrogenase family protein [Plantactinospora soyae]MBE1489232.1 alkylation response protein AidB-like acyl-CoA dehydrogenase [Plantactinospora soyae]